MLFMLIYNIIKINILALTSSEPFCANHTEGTKKLFSLVSANFSYANIDHFINSFAIKSD